MLAYITINNSDESKGMIWCSKRRFTETNFTCYSYPQVLRYWSDVIHTAKYVMMGVKEKYVNITLKQNYAFILVCGIYAVCSTIKPWLKCKII